MINFRKFSSVSASLFSVLLLFSHFICHDWYMTSSGSARFFCLFVCLGGFASLFYCVLFIILVYCCLSFVLLCFLFCFFFRHDRPFSQLKHLSWLWEPSIHFSTVISWCSRFKVCLKSLTLHLLKRFLFLRRKSYLDVSSKIPLKQLGALLPGDVRSAWKLPRKFLNYWKPVLST